MSKHADTKTNNPGSILRWLGLGNSETQTLERGEASPSPAANGTKHTPGKEGRRDLLERITSFLLDNELDISPANLLAAHAALSGSDLRLARKIAARQTAGDAITQQWLDEAVGTKEEEADKKAELDQLMAKLQTSMVTFTDTTKAARSVTGDYNVALEKHVADIEQTNTTGRALSNLADIAKAMLERTRQVEEEMRRREQEANSLRKSLARAQRDAEIDHLTGLPNRRAFEGVLETHYREAQLQIDSMCVAFCDIDHFKRVNDTHGHDTGDRVIQAIAQVLSRISNDKCHVARHGGEEFVMLFRGMNTKEAQDRLNIAREQLADRRFVNRTTDEPIGRITFSGGIADVFAYADTRAALKAADEALYRAKDEGRNRIIIAVQ